MKARPITVSDLLPLKVKIFLDDYGQIIEKLPWTQSKTGRLVHFTITESTRWALQQWIEFSGKGPEDYLFTREKKGEEQRPISRSYLASLIKSWAEMIGLPPGPYSGHSLRRTKPTFLYKYGFSDVVRLADLLGHSDTKTVLRYLEIDTETTLNQAQEGDIFTLNPKQLTVLTPLGRDFLRAEFLDQFAEEIWQRLLPKMNDFLELKNERDR